MNLTILFKIQAVYVWFYAAMLWFAPEFAATGPGWYVEGTDMASNFKAFGQVTAVPLIGLGIFAWMSPSWVGDNLKKVAMIFGIYLNICFLLIQGYQVYIAGTAKLDPIGVAPTVILIALFFWQIRASD